MAGKAAFASVLGPHQLGVGMQNGIEKIIHSAWAFLRRAGPMLAALDLKNAFNMVSRRAIAEALQKFFPAELPWFLACYGSASTCATYTGGLIHDVLAGVAQGDSQSPFYLAAALHDVVCSLSAKFPSVWFMFYADNVHLLSTDYISWLAAQEALIDAIHPLSLSLNVKQCHFFGSGIQAGFEKHWHGEPDGVIVLGSLIGLPDYVEQFVKA